ncbi:transposase [Pseudomonas sp. TNT2022 ID681]|uniref:Transposase n=1 Tax=Pseudomonas fontis TaxID=2942633 RepID=A0ABT5NPV4_9PSED|nr:transposase [Pseudomonas fontis]MDD0974717.1 transposase [Pseudomonas fontis]MDD0990212.1 transposase [Pseudomonas fontis]
MGTMERYAKVGMQELDQRLAKIVEAARKQPVSVYRYGAPWVWIVSQDDWQSALKEVASCIPPGHSLVLLKPRVEETLLAHDEILNALARSSGMTISPHTLMHLLLLQLLYSVPSEKQLYEQLNYNLLFRWFVGLELKSRVWNFSLFSHDLNAVLASEQAVRLLQSIVNEVCCGALLQMPEFSLNLALLHSWLAKHSGQGGPNNHA